jgi:hypothetical protein
MSRRMSAKQSPSTLIQTYDRNTYEREKRRALDAWAQCVSKLAEG